MSAFGRNPTRQTLPSNPRHGRWLLLAVLPFLLADPRLIEAETVPLRVLLFANLATSQLSVPPRYRIHTHPASPLASDTEGWRVLQLQAHRGRISVSNWGLELSQIEITPLARETALFVGGKLYRGGLEVKGREGGLMLVNRVDLEEYLYGVLPQEVPVGWEMATLRAQAIVARTYALYKRKANGTADYDVSAHYLQDQRYDGYGAEQPRATQAVNETRGLVLTCAGALIPAYYHAESAGYTENSEDVWSSAHPCLRAVKADVYPASPYLQWSASLALPDIQAALLKSGNRVGAVQRLEPLERSATGRILRLKITHAQGAVVLRGTDFRMALGPEVIRSTRFTVEIRGGRALFNGQGWGHGVGMCQWCSQAMAELGYDYEAILKHYYRGAELIRYR
jgi:stage II sporulation protein D